MTSPAPRFKSSIVPKILAILEAHGWKAPAHVWPDGPPADLEIRRIRVGRGDRSAGAWSWFIWSDSHPLPNDVGSQWPATECVRMGVEGTRLYENPWGQTALTPKTGRS